MGFMSIRRIYPVFRSSIIDRSCFLFSRFHLRYLCHPRESKDRAASTYTSCKSKSRRLFYWREYTVHMFMNVRVQSYVRLFVCMCLFAAQGLWLVWATAWYRTNELGYRSRHTRSGLVFAWRHTSTNPSLADSEPWLRCLTFCLLSIFAMFSTLLGVTEIKKLYNIIIWLFRKKQLPYSFLYFLVFIV